MRGARVTEQASVIFWGSIKKTIFSVNTETELPSHIDQVCPNISLSPMNSGRDTTPRTQ